MIPEVFPENGRTSFPRSGCPVSELDMVVAAVHPREYLNHTFSSALTLQHGTHTLKAGGLFALEH